MNENIKSGFEALKNYAVKPKEPDNFSKIIAQVKENSPLADAEPVSKETQDALMEMMNNRIRDNLNDQVLTNMTRQQEELRRIITLP